MDVILHDAMVQGGVRTLAAALFLLACYCWWRGWRAKSASHKWLLGLASLLLCFASCTVDAVAPLLPVG